MRRQILAAAPGHHDPNSTRYHQLICVWMSYLLQPDNVEPLQSASTQLEVVPLRSGVIAMCWFKYKCRSVLIWTTEPGRGLMWTRRPRKKTCSSSSVYFQTCWIIFIFLYILKHSLPACKYSNYVVMLLSVLFTDDLKMWVTMYW